MFKKIGAAFPYKGSKRRQAEQILSKITTKPDRIVEPFAGSGAISIHAKLNMIDNIWLNDAHAPLAGIWKYLRDTPRYLVDYYEFQWDSSVYDPHKHYFYIRDLFNKHQDPKAFYYLLHRIVFASVRFNSDGLLNSAPYTWRRGARPTYVKKRAMQIHEIIQGCKITNHDYKDVLNECDESDLVYLDPPYAGPAGTKYFGSFDSDEFVNALYKLKDKNVKFIVSYDGSNSFGNYGKELPRDLRLEKYLISNGQSIQTQMAGKPGKTFEALYCSL